MFRHSRFGAAFLLVLALLLWGAAPGIAVAASRVQVTVDLSRQRMDVSVGGRHSYSWAVSTARRGYRTPTGTYHPIRLERMWYSTKYDNAPMPWSIFFRGGYAIHGTNDIRHLGKPVSHGCIRLHPDNARVLFSLVRARPLSQTTIRIVP